MSEEALSSTQEVLNYIAQFKTVKRDWDFVLVKRYLNLNLFVIRDYSSVKLKGTSIVVKSCNV